MPGITASLYWVTSNGFAVAPVLFLNLKSERLSNALKSFCESPLDARPKLEPEATEIVLLYSPFCKSPLNAKSITVLISLVADAKSETYDDSILLSFANLVILAVLLFGL